jgi:hypothetical protein
MIRLICDPYRISRIVGSRVRTLADELAAFRLISDTLQDDDRGDTGVPLVFVVETTWEHFRSYRSLRGIDLQFVTPRSLLKSRFNCEPAPWLTDLAINDLQLLDNPALEASLIDGDWAATVCSVLYPGIVDAASLDGLLFLLASSSNQLALASCPTEVNNWLVNRFESLAHASIHVPEIVAELCKELRTATSPVAFAQDFCRRKALSPLLRPDTNRVLNLPNLRAESPRLIALSGHLPLLFPQPGALHNATSELITQAMRKARLANPRDFEAVVLAINAVWDGVAEEISTWLDICPRALTTVAISHLRSLPGFESNPTIQRITQVYAPPESVPQWSAMDDAFDMWVTAYAKFISSCFFRRDLPQVENDPATAFGTWVKDNPSLIFNHPERGYRHVAARIQRALSDRRAVIVVLVDAFAIQLVELLSGYLSDTLGVSPTSTSYVFAPLPTITEVCKEAILTGRFPSDCNGNLQLGIAETFDLDAGHFELAMNWRNAERVQLTAKTKLLVYRDNRIDDQLHSLPTFKALYDECPAIFSRLSRLIERWVGDMEQLHGQQPLLLITADHGFTFGPPSAYEARSSERLSGGQRCVALADRPRNKPIDDPSLTFIDRSVFHLRQDFLAARGRFLGQDTSLGWILSHGGLLPEEVIIPVLEWFGSAESIHWPELSFSPAPYLDRDKWSVVAVVSNPTTSSITGLTLSFNVALSEQLVVRTIPRIGPGDQVRLPLQLSAGQVDDSPMLLIDHTMAINRSDLHEPKVRSGQFALAKAKQLSIRTKVQADFEDMF